LERKKRLEEAMSEQTIPEEEVRQQRSRLIDHFKRAYQIIVGLAITLACGKLFAHGTIELSDPALLLFCTFFITVVPIFHGGDRSLDLKYLGEKPSSGWNQLAYIWDVYMLLITAIFFVKIAQAIPGPGIGFLDNSGTAIAGHFYDWMAAMLFFDASVLFIDGVKSALLGSRAWTRLQVYVAWIFLNVVLGILCLVIPQTSWSPEAVGIVVFLAAFVRTVLDYIAGSKFMFP
jgi:hypothetical protein